MQNIQKLSVTRMVDHSTRFKTVEYRLQIEDGNGHLLTPKILKPSVQTTLHGDDFNIFYWLTATYSTFFIDTLRMNKFNFSDEQIDGLEELPDRMQIRVIETEECVYGNGDNFANLLTVLSPAILFVLESSTARAHALFGNLFQDFLPFLDLFYIMDTGSDVSSYKMRSRQSRRENSPYSRLPLVQLPFCDVEKFPNGFRTSEAFKMDFAIVKSVIHKWLNTDGNYGLCEFEASIPIRYRDPAVFLSALEIAHAEIKEGGRIKIRHPLQRRSRLHISLRDEYNELADTFECFIAKFS